MPGSIRPIVAARVRGARLVLLPLLALPLLAGCFSYAPASLRSAGENSIVRLTLTPAGRTALEPSLGSSVQAIEGRLTRAPDDSVALRVSRLRAAGDVEFRWTNAPLTMPTGYVAAVQRQSLSRTRTALVVIGAAAASWAIVELTRTGGRARGIPTAPETPIP